MPGIIQVSVVGLMEASAIPFTFKVAMGKKECQSMGQGDCSLPVVSLRDNLTVVIHDVEGNEVFQTEFRTISVVEKGLLEGSYPLKSGGHVLMKLRFFLSQEEHMRIREMRESALKRKLEEQLQTENKGSISGQKTGDWITCSISEEGSHLEQSKQTDPVKVSLQLDCNLEYEWKQIGFSSLNDSSGPSDIASLQASEQQSEHSIKRDCGQLIEERKGNLKIQAPVDGVNKGKVSSEVGLDLQSECSRPLISGNATEHSYSDSAELKENRTRSNVKKMITAFESSVFQGPEPRFGPRMKSSPPKVDMESSLKRVPSEESDIDKLKSPQVISKSFSSGMLSDMNSQKNPSLLRSAFLKRPEDLEHVGPARKWETMGKGKAAFKHKNYKNLKSQDPVEPKAVKETMCTTKPISSVRFIEHVNKGDGPVSIVFKKGPSTLDLKRDFKAAKKILKRAVISEKSKILDTQTVSGAADAKPSSRSGEEPEACSKHNPADEGSSRRERTDNGSGIFEQSITENPQSPKLLKNVKTEAVRMKEKEKCASLKETPLSRENMNESARKDEPGSLRTHHQRSSLSALTKENESEYSRIGSDEEIASPTPNGAVDSLTYFDNGGCPIGDQDVWTTRHLCITTGTRQLRDLVDCCTSCGGMHPIEKNPSLRSGDEKPDDDASIQVNKNGKSSCTSVKPNHENSVGITKSNGGLIELGVRIAILLVACGTLLFNTRQRKLK